jgi:predicted nucleic acid-binding Zn ribbon protein
MGMHYTIRVRVRNLKRYTECNEDRTEPRRVVSNRGISSRGIGWYRPV